MGLFLSAIFNNDSFNCFYSSFNKIDNVLSRFSELIHFIVLRDLIEF